MRLVSLTLAVALVACRREDLPPDAVIEGPAEVAVGEWVQLEGLSSEDPEGNALLYEWAFFRLPQGSTAAFNEPRAVNPSFLADVAGEYEVELRVDDGLIYSEPVRHVVTAVQGNRAPVADAGLDRAAGPGDVVTLDGSRSTDPDGDSLAYAWRLIEQPAGAAAALDDAAIATPSFTAAIDGRFVWALVVSDGQVESAEDRVTIAVGSANLPPVADAGLDRIAVVGDTITFDGSRSSDPNGDALDYSWTLAERPDGSSAGLVDAGTVAPSLTVDVAGTWRVQLVVDDGAGPSAPDEVVVEAVIETDPPTVDAGDDANAQTGSPFHLDGSGSTDPDGDALAYAWRLVALPEGSAARLNDAAVVNPTFTPDVDGTYVAHLTVTDGVHVVGPDEVVITATGANRAPVADAGSDQSVPSGQVVQLDGTGSSDPDLDLLAYDWVFLELPAGSLAELNLATVANPSFVADVPGDYVLGVVVSDGALVSAMDTVTVSAFVGNVPPVASATAPASVPRGATVQLTSTSTDADGDLLLHEWWPVALPAGSAASLSDATLENPSFVADVAGFYVFRLQVSDGLVLSNVAEIEVEATEAGANQPPVADAGPDLVDHTGTGGADDRVRTGTVATLDGSASSDPDGDAIEYLWRFVSVPPGATATFNLATADAPSFVPDVDGTWVVELRVSDGEFSATDRVVVESFGANQPPVAVACAVDPTDASLLCPPGVAAPQLTVREGQTVQLDGSGSSDPDGDDLSYRWSFRALPAGFDGAFNEPEAVNPSFLAEAPGRLVARLRVDDGRAVSEPAEVEIQILEAFKVSAFDPENDETGVSLAKAIRVTFNQEVLDASVDEASVWINPGNASDLSQAIAVTYDESATHSVVLVPDALLMPLTQYTITVTTAVTNTLGEHLNQTYVSRFVTRAGEILIDTDPTDGETDVPVSSRICAFFTDDVDLATVTEDSFVVTFPDAWGRTEPIAWTIDPSTPGDTVCLVPSVGEYDCEFDRPLLYDTTYTARVTTDVALEGTGDTLTTDYVWTFTTTSAPEVVSTDPADGAVEVPIVMAPLEVRFDRALDPGTVQAATVTLATQAGTPVGGAATISGDGFAAWFTPSVPLAYNTVYRLTVAGGLDGVLDDDGNWLMADEVVTFRTSPANSYVQVPKDTTPQGSLIELRFARPIDPSTMSAASIPVWRLDSGGAPVDLANTNYAWDPDTQVVSITTVPEVANNTSYSVTVTPDVLDWLGNPMPSTTTLVFAVSGNANSGAGLSLGRTGDAGHARYWVQGSKDLLISSVDAASLTFRDAGGAPVPYRVVAYDTANNRVVIEPDDYLRSNLDPYVLTATPDVTDLNRNASAQVTASYTIESTGPTVIGVSPVNGTTQVKGHATVIVSFSERMDEASLTTSTVRLLAGATPVPATLTVAANGLSATLVPSAYLNAGATYTVSVTTGAKDTAGNAITAFSSTFVVDTVAPTVADWTPDPSAGPGTDVTVTFSERMDEATFIESIVGADGTLRVYQGATEAYGCVVVAGEVATFDPVDPLPLGTLTIEVDAAVTDTAGNALGAPFTTTFTVQ